MFMRTHPTEEKKALKQARALITLGIVLVLALTACTGKTQDSAEPQAQRGGRIVLGQAAGPVLTLDPAQALDRASALVVDSLFSTLLRVGQDGKTLEPEAAESYTLSDDGLTYTFTLRENIQFSDGTPVTPADVIFSLQRTAGEGSRWAWMMPPIETLEADGDRGVRIVLADPSPSFDANMATLMAAILPQKLVEAQGEAFWDQPVGSGPFVVKEWAKGERVVLARNETYWNAELPYLDEVEIEPAGDDNTRQLKFQAGEYDISLSVPPNQVETTSQLETARVSVDTSSSIYCILINQGRGPLGDIHVRRAMNYAVDKQGLIKAVVFDQAQEATSFLPPMLYWNDELDGYPYDVDKAKEEMAQSSVPNGFKIAVLANSGDQVSRNVVTALIDMWAQIGIELEPDLIERGAALQRAFQGDYDLFLNSFSGSTIDPELLSKAMVYGKGFTAPLMGYQNARLDELVEQPSADPETRRQAYHEVQKLANEDAPLVLLFYPKQATALQDNVKGFTMVPTGDFDLSRIWLAK
jgi:peptide/nickel transport system substrate-binding protein